MTLACNPESARPPLPSRKPPVCRCLPPATWTPDDERDSIARRRDLRHLNVCSVDPPGCTDIDDALHVRRLDNGNYEVRSSPSHSLASQ